VTVIAFFPFIGCDSMPPSKRLTDHRAAMRRSTTFFSG